MPLCNCLRSLAGNAVLEAIQHEERLTFSAEKCGLLKIDSKDDTRLGVEGELQRWGGLISSRGPSAVLQYGTGVTKVG